MGKSLTILISCGAIISILSWQLVKNACYSLFGRYTFYSVTLFATMTFLDLSIFYLCFVTLITFTSSEKPRLLSLHKLTKLLPNKSHMIVCNAIAGSIPISFEYFSGNSKILPSTKYKIDVIGEISTLTLTNLSQYDSGTYTCKASNEFGYAEVFSEILVQGFYQFYQLHGAFSYWTTRCDNKFVHLDFIETNFLLDLVAAMWR